MNVLFISIDSLRRDYLGAYGDEHSGVDTRNLDRFAERATIFDSHYAGSLPCMPARREWLTGTQEFLWRMWGPVEPFDRTLPLAARENEVVTQLVTDHFHYFQHGSSGYYEDFNGFEFVRGQEFDAWQTAPRDPPEWLLRQVLVEKEGDPDDIALNERTAKSGRYDLRYQNRVAYARNAADFDEEIDFFSPQVFSRTADWLVENADWPQWFCYVDSFDVHEPFHLPEPYASMYTDEDPRDPELTIWPYYGRTDRGQSVLSERELDFVKSQFAGNVTMVDRWFGRVLEKLDDLNLWENTVVIVTSDHGFYLGDHDWVGKPYRAPVYDTLARTPLLIWHPKSARMGERIDSTTAAVDLYATILDVLGVSDYDPRHSRSLVPVIDGKTDHVRERALYGFWGSSVNVTNGQYTYHQPCDPDVPTACYSTQMTNPYGWFVPDDPQLDAQAGTFLPYTDTPVWRYEGPSYQRHESPLLFDTETDPVQETNLYGTDADRDAELVDALVDEMQLLGAPEEQYERLSLSD